MHSGDLTRAIAVASLCPGVVIEKRGGKAWGVVEDPKWLTHVFELYASGNEETRNLVKVGRVGQKQYSRETDQGCV